MPGGLSILVTGATGYVGGRLVPRLAERGHQVRCLVRDLGRIRGRGWDSVEAVVGDALDYETLVPAMAGIDVAYYLIHSLAGGEREFDRRDRLAAVNFGWAARQAGVRRIIYLGGLGSDSDELSLHLKSRQETGNYLRASGVPVTEFRAGVIVGSGGVSFELIRYLTERVPILICPPWIKTRAQPIGIRDVLRYLCDCLDVTESTGRVLEIGGRDILSYEDMIRIYARMRGLNRRLVVVPWLTPGIMALAANLLTPMPSPVILPLFEGLRNEVVCRDHSAIRMFGATPLSYEENIRLALDRIETGTVETVWSDAFSSSPRGEYVPVELANTQGMLIEKRQRPARASTSSAFQVISSIGGSNGWPYANFLWRMRGVADRLSGGAGLRSPRRNPRQLRVGDALDFWRVEAVEPDQLLRLRSEMRLPGRAWLQFEVEPLRDDEIVITQTALYEPHGLLGLLYWYLSYPLHRILFPGFIRTLARQSEELETKLASAKQAGDEYVGDGNRNYEPHHNRPDTD